MAPPRCSDGPAHCRTQVLLWARCAGAYGITLTPRSDTTFLLSARVLCALRGPGGERWNSPPRGRPRPEPQFAESWSPSGPPRRRLWPPSAPQAYGRNEPPLAVSDPSTRQAEDDACVGCTGRTGRRTEVRAARTAHGAALPPHTAQARTNTHSKQRKEGDTQRSRHTRLSTPAPTKRLPC